MEQALQVINTDGVRGYLDEKGTAWLNVEDVARGLGFTQFPIKNGKEYASVRYERINHYLAEWNFPQKVSKGDFIPENIFYRLAFKAKNKTAQAFQVKVADEILPSIRKYGLLMSILSNPAMLAEILGVENFEPAKKCVYVFEMENGRCKIGVTQDSNRRINEVMNNSGMEVVRKYRTEPMVRRDAYRLESKCHKIFSADRKRGEFFDIEFDDACKAIEHEGIVPVAEREGIMADLL